MDRLYHRVAPKIGFWTLERAIVSVARYSDTESYENSFKNGGQGGLSLGGDWQIAECRVFGMELCSNKRV